MIVGASEKTCPGLTCFEKRLNALLTRQRSGLVTVTELYSAPKIRDRLVGGGDGKVKVKGKGKAEDKFQVDGVSGGVVLGWCEAPPFCVRGALEEWAGC